MKRKLYFVTLNWNTTDMLRDMIESVESTTVGHDHEWLVLDNGSDRLNWQGLMRMLGYMGLSLDRFRVARFEKNQGLIIGHNHVFGMAAEDGGPHEIVMIDTDVTVTEAGWLTRVLEWGETRPEIGIIGLEHSRDEVCSPAIFLDQAGYWYLHGGQTKVNSPCEAESAGLGFALIRWPVLQAGLRFDTQYRMYYKQDDDLCFQVRAQLGLEVWAFPVGNVHYGSGSLKQAEYVVEGVSESQTEWDAMKRANQRRFADKWAWALRNRRRDLSEEAVHLAEMKRLMADEGRADD